MTYIQLVLDKLALLARSYSADGGQRGLQHYTPFTIQMGMRLHDVDSYVILAIFVLQW
jgi:hypothetical protein